MTTLYPPHSFWQTCAPGELVHVFAAAEILISFKDIIILTSLQCVAPLSKPACTLDPTYSAVHAGLLRGATHCKEVSMIISLKLIKISAAAKTCTSSPGAHVCQKLWGGSSVVIRDSNMS